MDLSDAELMVLRLHVNQAHNEAVWARVNVERFKHMSCSECTFNPVGVEADASMTVIIDLEFEASLVWLSNSRKPWA